MEQVGLVTVRSGRFAKGPRVLTDPSSAFHNPAKPAPQAEALICFSHLRWDFVLQRPQHLMERFAKGRRVFFFEEQIPTDHHLPYLELHSFDGSSVTAVRPRVPKTVKGQDVDGVLARLVDKLLVLCAIKRPVLWFYTPMMLPIASHVDAAAIVYDCMDELSAFRFAPPALKQNEAELLKRSDVVFTGGHSIYEVKRQSHGNVHAFPSSVDVAHFATARQAASDPGRSVGPEAAAVSAITAVIDERLDLALIADVAKARPDWSFVFVGPVVKIDERDLPSAPNLHFLGRKSYAELPKYLTGWDVALMPFAMNEATRFISPDQDA